MRLLNPLSSFPSVQVFTFLFFLSFSASFFLVLPFSFLKPPLIVSFLDSSKKKKKICFNPPLSFPPFFLPFRTQQKKKKKNVFVAVPVCEIKRFWEA